MQEQLIREYVEAFQPHAMVPVLVPIGQEVGDVLDKLGQEIVHRRDECFDGLSLRKEPSRLPNFDLGASAALRLGLGLDLVADADLRALGSSRVIVRFSDVTVESASQGELRRAVKRGACPEVAHLVDKDPEALKQDSFLVGTVFRARSIVRVDRVRDGGGGVNSSWLTAFAGRFGLRLRAEGGGNVENARTVELSGMEPLPVAFRPAFIRLDPGSPSYRDSPVRDRPVIVTFDPDREGDRKALQDWIALQLPRVLPKAQ